MIIPVLHRIVVKQDKLEEKDETYRRAKQVGIEIPVLDEKTREQAAIDTGVVKAIGNTAFKDFHCDSPPIEVGDTIVFAKYAGKTVTDVDGEKYVLLNDEDVICRLIQD